MFLTDPIQRPTLEMVAVHPWVVGDMGLIPHFFCWCNRNKLRMEQISDGGITNAPSVINTD